MHRRDLLKIMGMAVAAGILPVLATYSEKNKLERFVRGKLRAADFEIGYCEGFRFIETQQLPDWPKPEQPKGRQKVDAFIHRKLGHYGF